jgi:serine/threonine protein kinase
MLAALHFLHEKHVIHRDINASNTLMTKVRCSPHLPFCRPPLTFVAAISTAPSSWPILASRR